MTKQETIQRAKSSILRFMTRYLDSSNVSNSVVFFAADEFNPSTERHLDKINIEIASLISRLKSFKTIVEEHKQKILDADE